MFAFSSGRYKTHMPVIEIKTLIPGRAHWAPVKTGRGYQLVSRAIPYPDRNRAALATFVATLDDAADLIGIDYAIRMGEPGASRGNYHYPEDLKIVRI